MFDMMSQRGRNGYMGGKFRAKMNARSTSTQKRNLLVRSYLKIALFLIPPNRLKYGIMVLLVEGMTD